MLIDLVRLADKPFAFIPAKLKASPRLQSALGLVVLTLVLSLTVYGGWNARHPVINKYDLTVNKKANGLKQLRIIMVSDIHLGDIIRPARLNPLVEAVNRLRPDLVLFAGDIVERSLDAAEARELVNILGRMKAKYGIFAVTGNHDRPRGEGSNIVDHLKSAGITVLEDSYEKVGGGAYIIGRKNADRRHREESDEAAKADDAAEAAVEGPGPAAGENPGGRPPEERRDLAELLQGVDSTQPLILLDHQPIDLEKAQSNKVDLQLSGHTHNGQVFPISLITGQIYEMDWGMLTKGAYNIIVSSGYGTWGPPLRIGNNPEIVDISVRFK